MPPGAFVLKLALSYMTAAALFAKVKHRERQALVLYRALTTA